MSVQFTLNSKSITVHDIDPHTTLLEWLRNHGLTGTKEVCAEGECGACAVAIVRANAQGTTAYEVINSCLFPLPAAHGLELVTIEGVTPEDGSLHPVQAAMVSHGASQCGYCTPGIVMSMFAEFHRPDRTAFDQESIAGHLCRCTGYRPIREAALSLGTPQPSSAAQRRLTLAPTAPQPIALDHTHGKFVRPKTLGELFEHWASHAEATPIAGGTDMMVYANQQHQRWSQLMAIEELEEMRGIQSSTQEVSIGAAEPLAHIEYALQEVPIFAQLWPLFSSRLIRNRATLGGSLATASPIGDAAPALMALNAQLTLTSASGDRQLAVADFFVNYRQTILGPQELIRRIHIPKPLPSIQRFYKVSKRQHDDISTVAAGFTLSLGPKGEVLSLGIGLGGIAAKPIKPVSVEASAQGRIWSKALVNELSEQLQGIGSPIDDFRGSAAYRKAMLGQLLLKFWFETQEVQS